MSIIEMRDVVKKYDNGTTALRGITVSHLVQELEEIIVRQLDIRDFIVVAETETALAIDFASLQTFFECRLGSKSKTSLVCRLNGCSTVGTRKRIGDRRSLLPTLFPSPSLQ